MRSNLLYDIKLLADAKDIGDWNMLSTEAMVSRIDHLWNKSFFLFFLRRRFHSIKQISQKIIHAIPNIIVYIE